MLKSRINTNSGAVFDQVIHRYLRVPYRLHMSVVKKGRRPRQTILFIHGIGNSGLAWSEVIRQLPDDTRAITVDLLGFGQSRRPSWVAYDVATQARAVLRTCLRYGVTGDMVIVGHSMGALVAIEFARRYPLLARSLILCSPPLYRQEHRRLLPNSEAALRRLYRAAHQSPEQFVKLSSLAMKYDLINASFNVTDENVDSYMNALEAAIINQSSLQDIRKLTLPIHIIRGSLDPVLVSRPIKQLAKDQPNVTVSTVAAGHEVRGRFIPKVIEAIAAMRQ